MSSFPQYLEYFSQTIENVSVARFKVPPTSNSAVQSHQQIQFLLPSNAMVNMRTAKVAFQVTTDSGKARLPPLASSYFSRISIEMGGQTVSSFESANLLDHILVNNMQLDADPVSEKSKLTRKVNPVTILDMSKETYDTSNNKAYFNIDLGVFARSVQPGILALNLCPTMSITLHLAENAVVSSPENITTAALFIAPAPAGQSKYTIENSNLLVDVLDISGGDLMAVYQATMLQEGFLEITYDHWSSFTDTFNTVARCSSSAMSLNKVVATFRRSSGNRAPFPNGNAGYNGVNGCVGSIGYNNQLLASLADVGTVAGVLGTPDSNGTDFTSAYFTMTAPTTLAAGTAISALVADTKEEPQINLSVNNVQFPSYNCAISEWYEVSKSAWGISKSKSLSLAEYCTNKFSICQSFNLPASSQLRLISGLNLKASNAQINLSVTGGSTNATTDDNVVIYLCSSNIIRLGSGKQLQILH